MDKLLDHLIILNTEDNFNFISGQQYSEEILNTDESRNIQYLANKKVINKNHFDKTSLDQINSLNCLFTWNLQTSTSKKDLISLLRKKYGNYNLDIGLPFFTFERYNFKFFFLKRWSITGCLWDTTGPYNHFMNKILLFTLLIKLL